MEQIQEDLAGEIDQSLLDKRRTMSDDSITQFNVS